MQNTTKASLGEQCSPSSSEYNLNKTGGRLPTIHTCSDDLRSVSEQRHRLLMVLHGGAAPLAPSSLAPRSFTAVSALTTWIFIPTPSSPLPHQEELRRTRNSPGGQLDPSFPPLCQPAARPITHPRVRAANLRKLPG